MSKFLPTSKLWLFESCACPAKIAVASATIRSNLFLISVSFVFYRLQNYMIMA